MLEFEVYSGARSAAQADVSDIMRRDHGLEVLTCAPPHAVAKRPHPLVFVHGAFAAAWCWDEHFMPWFAQRGYDCYAVSLRGHGDSIGHDSLHDYGVDAYVADIRALTDQLAFQGAEAPVLIGHSMGGFVAMRYMETGLDAGSTAGLILLASVPPNGLTGSSMSLAAHKPALLQEIALIQSLDPSWASLEMMREALFSAEDDPKVMQRHFGKMGSESMRATYEMHGPLSLNPIPWRDRTPRLVLGGARDALIGRAFVKSTARQLDTRAEFIPETGHGMMLDRHWETVAERMCRWLWAEGL